MKHQTKTNETSEWNIWMKHLNETSEWSIWMKHLNETSEWNIRQRQIKHLNEASDQYSMKARRANSLASNIIAPFWHQTLTIGITLRPARQTHRYTSSENVDVCAWCVGTVCTSKKSCKDWGNKKQNKTKHIDTHRGKELQILTQLQHYQMDSQESGGNRRTWVEKNTHVHVQNDLKKVSNSCWAPAKEEEMSFNGKLVCVLRYAKGTRSDVHGWEQT